MAKKRSDSSVRDKRAAKREKHIKHKKIDFSDIPESTDAELKKARRVGRPKSATPKQLIAIRIDPFILESLQKMAAEEGKPYQTFIHELLEGAVKKSA